MTTRRMMTGFIVAVIVGLLIALASPITSPAQWLILPGAYLAFGLACLFLSKARKVQS